MCIDSTDLNMACTKDNYLLHSVDMQINGASYNENLTILDDHLGYNLILMKKNGKKKQQL